MAKMLAVAAAAALLVLVVFAGYRMNLLESLERQFIFFPTSEIERTPADVGLAYDDVSFISEDGLTLNGWYVPGPSGDQPVAQPEGRITLIWFHGNGGNMGHRVEDLALFHHLLEVDVFIFDYRGYGLSEGQASEKGVYLDARAALDYVKFRRSRQPSRTVYFGRSLGTAVAAELAVHEAPDGMILYSPFSSIGDLAANLYPLSPLRLLAGKRFDSLSRIQDYHGPLLVIHGQQDEIIPAELGEALFKAANEPKQFLLLPQARHNDGLDQAGPSLWQSLAEFIDSLPETGGN